MARAEGTTRRTVMGRRENAVAASTRQMEALALWLRAQSQREALTYAAMAQRINYGFTASMLSRAAGGPVLAAQGVRPLTGMLPPGPPRRPGSPAAPGRGHRAWRAGGSGRSWRWRC
ncbi:hypothetical protein GCM10010336_51290 [Streptomyces goshikiensis]|nr:hypothetical protein GCM10010336_51290 [Streptomyces goshikiensis]